MIVGGIQNRKRPEARMFAFVTAAAVVCLMVIAMLLPSPADAISSGDYIWVPQAPASASAEYASVSATSSTNAWAVGAGGSAYRYNGTTVTQSNTGTTNDLFGVSAVTDGTNRVWAVGEGGTIRYFNGSSWAGQSSPNLGYAYDLWSVSVIRTGNNNYRAWAVGTTDGFHAAIILYYNGSAWSVDEELDTGQFNDVTALRLNNRTYVWVSGSDNETESGNHGRVMYSTGNGTWTMRNTDYAMLSIAAVNATNLFAVEWNGTVYRSTNGGTAWSQMFTDDWPLAVSATATNNVWVVGWDGTASYFNGTNWTDRSSTGKDLYEVSALGANSVFGVGDGRFMYNNGSWSEKGSGNSQTQYGVEGYMSGTDLNVLSVGANDATFGNIQRTTNGGTTWSTFSSGTTNTLNCVDAVDASNIWVGGYQSLRKYNGSSWSSVYNIASGASVNSISMASSSYGWAGTSDGRILRCYNGSWGQDASIIDDAAINGVAGVSNTYGYMVGDPTNSGSVGAFACLGGSYSRRNNGIPDNTVLNSVVALSTASAWAVGDGGVIYKTTNSANNWTAQTSGTTENLNGISALSTDTDVAWAVGDNGTILYTDDGGANWTQQDSPTAGNLNSVWAYDSTHAWAVGDGGYIIFADPPIIQSVSPSQLAPGTTTTGVIYGEFTNFDQFSSVIDMGDGVTATPLTDSENPNISNTYLECSISVAADAAPGPRDITVTTADEVTETLIGGFTVLDRPAISGISPARAVPGQSVTITGSDFGVQQDYSGTDPLSVVSFNGAAPAECLSWSDTSITCVVPEAATSGPLTVSSSAGVSDPVVFGIASAGSSWFLPEGSTAWGFNTYITIANPNESQVEVTVTYSPTGAEEVSETITLPPSSQTTLANDHLVSVMGGQRDFSTRVETADPQVSIAVDRTMRWGEGANEEGHSSVGVNVPNTEWYFPEGSTNWGFETWTLVQNPNDTEATCTFTYMIEGEGEAVLEHKVPAGSRASFPMVEDIGNKDASIMVQSDLPVVPERSVYRDNRRAGHDSIGTTTPETTYFLAEGSTAWGYTTYVLVQNPNDEPVDVAVTYMTDGPLPQEAFTMPAHSRKTIRVNDVAGLENADFSTTVSSDLPIIAERSMYWDNGTGEAGHDSIGLSEPHAAFCLPDGQSYLGYETYVLVQNPNDAQVDVRITYLPNSGGTPIVRNETIAASSRESFNMLTHAGEVGGYSVLVECVTADAGIMVERSMYWNMRGAGTGTIGAVIDFEM